MQNAIGIFAGNATGFEYQPVCTCTTIARHTLMQQAQNRLLFAAVKLKK